MFKQIKQFWWQSSQYAKNLPCARKMLRSGYLHQVGYFRSCREKIPVDTLGNPLPWYAYSAIHFLDARLADLKLSPSLKVFEHGSGYSTLWWSKRCESLHCCEHSTEWFNIMKKLVPNNVTMSLITEDRISDYSEAAGRLPHRNDVIIIDGIARNECAFNATSALSERGVIIFDDSQRDQYGEGIRHILSSGFRRLDFVGLGPITTNKQSTTIFYRDNNCLGI